ncbi:MAG: type II secretion system protein, partial [Planctomycetota bacterium]
MRKVSCLSNVNNKRHAGFTLIELLVVIAILSLLIAILLPVLNQAKHHARRAACTGNLRQIGVAIHMYAEDFSDT